MGIDRAAAARAWLDARWSHASLNSAGRIADRQVRLWKRMAPVVARTPAVSALAGRPLAGFPVMDPASLREGFDQWNTLGLTRTEAEAAAARGEAGGSGEIRPGIVAGFSSGSSGRPGLFVTSAAERAGWLGHILGRLLPASTLFRPTRIALCLRADNRLYGDVRAAGPFRFLFTGLDVPPEERLERLRAFAPDVLIAPPGVLADLARRIRPPWSLRHLFYGAEPMGDIERAWIGETLGVRPDPIYQATEGFLGATCRHGTLHLNEDVLIVEREPVHGTTRFLPIITDLRRTTQPMIRVRLPDLLEPLDGSCRCGSALTAVRPVEGRLEDLWRWPGITLCPREIEDALSAALGPQTDWRAIGSPTGVSIEVQPEHAEVADRSVRNLLAHHGLAPSVIVTGPVDDRGVKRRRVRWSDG